MRTIKKGARGEEVKMLQRALGINADGIFGAQTERAVMDYQRSKGLVADGIVGAKTWSALGIVDNPTQSARRIDYIFIHCTAGSQIETANSILNFFYKVRKWSRPGYHYIVEADGKTTNIWSESKYSNGVKGYNAHSINIAWVGGVTKQYPNGVDNRTDAQKIALRKLLMELRKRYPKAVIMGHRDVSPDLNHNGIIETWEWIKTCPCFDAKKEYEKI